MGGFFGTISKRDCVLDVFFGTDYHSHLGTKRAGMIVNSEENIQNTVTMRNCPKKASHGISSLRIAKQN